VKVLKWGLYVVDVFPVKQQVAGALSAMEDIAVGGHDGVTLRC
jgi:hypothetical protein